jgi:tripartite-type tricarboxylate transporter receptor subunit TctC
MNSFSKPLQGVHRRTVLTCLAASGAALFQGQVLAQAAFPSRPVKIVVPFTPGGSNDVVARILAQRLTEIWGQPVVVDNKAGAAGNIGSDFVAKAAPDGYNLLITNNNTVSINPALLPNMPFDATKDFVHVSQVGALPMVLVVNSNVPARNIKELLALAKTRPDGLKYASSGTGSPQHMFMELFKSVTGMKALHVPYKGAGPAVTDMLGGVIDMQINAINSLVPHIRSGRLTALGITGKSRAALLPEVPTFSESGVPGLEGEVWLGLAAPAHTPAAVVEKINADVARVLAEPDTKAKLAEQGIRAKSSTPQEMTALAAEELKNWTKVIKSAGIKPD